MRSTDNSSLNFNIIFQCKPDGRKNRRLYDVEFCSEIKFDRLFGGSRCLCLQGENGTSKQQASTDEKEHFFSTLNMDGKYLSDMTVDVISYKQKLEFF
jgi:hypothetical protein